MASRKDAAIRGPGRAAGIGLAAALITAGAVGCSGILGLGGDRLADNLDRWRSNRPAVYEFTYRNRCFCAGTEPVVITVEADSIVDVSPAEGGGSPPLPESRYRTIEGLFVQVAEWQGRDPDHRRLEFDERLGYPTDVFFDFRENVADEEQGFEVTGLRALERLQ